MVKRKRWKEVQLETSRRRRGQRERSPGDWSGSPTTRHLLEAFAATAAAAAPASAPLLLHPCPGRFVAPLEQLALL
eukprot:512490-Prorocentrum_minimum.AAC.1